MYGINQSGPDAIIRVLLTGTITLDETEHLARELFELTYETEKSIRLLTDARSAEYAFGVVELRDIGERTEKYLRPGARVREAILIDKPLETAISMLFEGRKQFRNHQTRIFSTEQAALDWLALQE